MNRSLPWLLALAGAVHAQTAKPAADYIYPSGADAPLNTRILARASWCGGSNQIAVSAGAQPVAGRVEAAGRSDVGCWFVFTPAQPLMPRTRYTVTVSVPSFTPTTGVFTTGAGDDVSPPAVLSTVPSHKQDWVGGSIAIRFSKPINPLTLDNATPSLVRLADGTEIYGTGWIMADALTLQSVNSSRLPAGDVFRVYFRWKLPQDLAGNTLAVAPDFIFTTYPEAPKDGLRLRGSIPAEGESAVPTNTALFLVFDRPPMLPAAGTLSLSSDADPNVPLKVEAMAWRNALVVRPQFLLRANQEYTLRAVRLYDQYGGQVSSDALLRFRTGAMPETRALQAVVLPAASLPATRVLRWRFSRAINPELLPRLGKIVGGTESVQLFDVRLLADGVTVESDVPGPGRYILAGQVYDRVECKPSSFGNEIVVSALRGDRPPALIAAFPTDAAAAPSTVSPAALFDEPLGAETAAQMTLWRGEERVPADVSLNGAILTIKPREPLPEGNYRAEVRAPVDLAGNAGADVTWTFRVDSAPQSEAFRVERIEPADGAQQVDVRSPVVVTFNRPPNPLSLTRREPSTAAGVVAGRWIFEGNKAIFQPDPVFPASARVVWRIDATDFSGSPAIAAGGFWTAAATAGGAFRVTAAEATPKGDIALEFSEPAMSGSVSAENVVVTCDGAYQYTSPVCEPGCRRASISVPSVVTGACRVIACPGVRSQSGAMLEPFSADVQIAKVMSYSYRGTPVLGPFIRSTVPPASEWIAADAPVVVFFVQAMDRNRVERALRVVAGDAAVPGRIDWAPDSTALTFWPAAPLPAGASISLLLSMVPWDGAGVEAVYFKVATASAPPAMKWSLLGPFASLPVDGAIDVEFDRDRPADYIRSAKLKWGMNREMPLEASARSARVFRLRAKQLLTAGLSYSVEVQTQSGDTSVSYFVVAPYATPESRRLLTIPTDAMGEVPLNALVWLQSQTPLNPIPFRARLTVNGVAHPVNIEFRDAGFLVCLRPVGLLQGQATYAVSVTGLEDVMGRALPDRTWTFHTGSGPDLVPAAMLSWTPSGIASPSSVLRVKYDKPVVLPHGSADNVVVDSDFSIPTETTRVNGAITPSEDGRTLAFVPARPWPLNTIVPVPAVLDWTGAKAGDRFGASFTTAPVPVTGLPVVESLNPYRDAEDVPLNVQIQARFNQPVLDSSLSRVRVELDGQVVAARVTLGPDGRTVTLLPGRVLDANRSYTVVVEAVRNAAGEVQDPVERWSFRTGDSLAAGPATALAFAVNPEPLAVRVEFSRPLNPLAVDPSALSFRVREVSVAVELELAANGRSLIVKPVQPVTANARCVLWSEQLRDWAGQLLKVNSVFSTGTPPDTEPPRVQSLLPAPGSSIPWNYDAVAVFNEPVGLRDGARGAQMMSRGAAVAARAETSATGQSLEVRPAGDWVPGETYSVELRGVLDSSGNEAPPVNWSFTIAGDGAADTMPLRLTGTTPEHGAVGVPPDTAVVFAFSKPVAPADRYYTPALSGSSGATSYALGHLLRPVYDNNRVQLSAGPFPAGATIRASVPVRDMAGYTTTGSVTFTTAAIPDNTPPQLESIVPAASSRLVPGVNQFTVFFSEPVFCTGSCAAFASGGQPIYPREISYPVQGDGRTLVIAIDVPAGVTGNLMLLSGITDLAGNPLTPVSLEYGVGPAADLTYLSVTMQPAGGGQVPLDAAIELRFNQPVSEAPLRAALVVWNDGYIVPVALAPENEGRVWRLTPPSPWLENTTVAVKLAATLYAVSGAGLTNPFTASFRTASGSATGALAAIDASAEAIDLRFAEPRTVPPEEPFGLRLGRQRVPVRIEWMGPAWFRLTPEQPLDPNRRYHLMAGPGVEIPVRLSEAHAFGGFAPAKAHVDDQGLIRVELRGEVHRFRIGPEDVQLLDGTGHRLPHEVRLTIDGRTLLIQPYTRVAAYLVVVGSAVMEGGAYVTPQP